MGGGRELANFHKCLIPKGNPSTPLPMGKRCIIEMLVNVQAIPL